MTSHTMKGRLLAIAAGAAFAVGGLTILLDKDLIQPATWTAPQWLTILTVFGTIAAGHLMADAARARHLFATLGFLTLFLSGTGLVVYNSVGRQVETAGTTTLSVEDANSKLADLKAEREKAVKRRDYADQQAAFEIAGRPDKRGRPTVKPGCGNNCQDWKQNSSDVSAKIESIDRDIDKIGPAKPVNAQAEAMAEIALLFHIPATKEQIVAALLLLIPFAKCLFFEIGSIVSLGFAFRSAVSPKIGTQTALSTNSDTESQTDFSAEFEARKIRAMVSGDFPNPTPPTKPRKRGRKADPNIINFTERFREKNGRAPSARDLRSEFPALPVSTAYDYVARARTAG